MTTLYRMTLEQIGSVNNPHFKDVVRLYRNSFPTNERRSVKGLSEQLKNKLVFLNAIIESSSNQCIGFVLLWKFSKFTYIEHFALIPSKRNQGFGRQILKILQNENLPIILEVEPVNSDVSANRVNFYQSLGFKMENYGYFQPAYGKNKKSIPMNLMTYLFNDSNINIDEAVFTIFEKVYDKPKSE